MKKTALAMAAFLVFVSFASAATMSSSDDGSGTLVQTYDTGEFTPGNPTTLDLSFAQFDTQGGTRTLQSVTVSVTQSAWGGYFAVDNDAETSALVTIQHGVTGSLKDPGDRTWYLPIGAGATLQTITSISRELAANDGDGIDTFDAGGDDYYKLEGPAKADVTPITASGTETASKYLEGARSFICRKLSFTIEFHFNP